MSTTHALIAASAGAALEPGTIERRDLRDDDVQIDVKFAGICHSDIHQVREEWGQAIFPMVPGHEIAGIVSAVGPGVTRYQVGDRVGVGCMVDSCGECEFCKDGEEQYCTKGAVMTYNGTGYDGEKTMGGYSQQVVVSERFTLGIPEGIELDAAAPLLCAGITTYSPLKRWGAGPGKKVAVIGMGGLGHMAVKIAAALGAEVTVLPARSTSRRTPSGSARRTTSPRRTTRPSRTTPPRSTSSSTRSAADLPMDAYMGAAAAARCPRQRRPAVQAVRGRALLRRRRQPGPRRLEHRRHRPDPGDARLLRRAPHRGRDRDDRRRPGQRGLRARRELRRALPLRHRHGHHLGLSPTRPPVRPAAGPGRRRRPPDDHQVGRASPCAEPMAVGSAPDGAGSPRPVRRPAGRPAAGRRCRSGRGRPARTSPCAAGRERSSPRRRRSPGRP